MSNWLLVLCLVPLTPLAAFAQNAGSALVDVRVESEPAGLVIFVNGASTYRRTPADVRLRPGVSTRVEVRSGSQVWFKDVVPAPGAALVIRFPGEAAPPLPPVEPEPKHRLEVTVGALLAPEDVLDTESNDSVPAFYAGFAWRWLDADGLSAWLAVTLGGGRLRNRELGTASADLGFDGRSAPTVGLAEIVASGRMSLFDDADLVADTVALEFGVGPYLLVPVDDDHTDVSTEVGAKATLRLYLTWVFLDASFYAGGEFGGIFFAGAGFRLGI